MRVMPVPARRPSRNDTPSTAAWCPGPLACLGVLAAMAASVSAQSFSGFAVQPTTSVGGILSGVCAIDYDSDGDMDAAVVVSGSAGQPGSLVMMTNNGRGVFARDWTIALGINPGIPVAAKLNNSGLPEIVVPNTGASTVSVVRLTSAGLPLSVTNHTVGLRPGSIAIANFNNDTFLDIAAASPGSGEVRVLLGDGAGFPSSRTFFTEFGSFGQGPRSIAAGDLNNDGRPDLFTANLGSNDISIFYNGGNANFFTGEFAIYIDQTENTYDARPADIDQDGDLDLVVARGLSNAQVVWYRNAHIGAGETFPDFNNGSFASSTGGRNVSLTVANLDCGNDAFPDILGANEGDGAPSFIGVLINPGSGSLSVRPPAPIGFGSPQHTAVADFDNDGDTDVVAVTLSGALRVFLNRCQGVNCPADLNNSGTLDFFDVLAFLNQFNNQDPVADIAAPAGVFNFFDVTAFLAQVNAGCP